ncbi:hypothetical protein VL14_09150 [Cytobacillus firmus]|jgi:hypothetical protein|nr:hypothetical protein VL14_09150 [Cytobacillus firmus]MBG9446376.1 hypothetical protein [Cytobacillus firmus]
MTSISSLSGFLFKTQTGMAGCPENFERGHLPCFKLKGPAAFWMIPVPGHIEIFALKTIDLL